MLTRLNLPVHVARLKAKGYEINQWLVLYSKVRAFREGLFGKAKFYRKDLWKTSLSEFDYIVLFGARDATR